MIYKLKTFGARTAFFLVILAGIGFGFIAAAMSTLIGALLVIGVRLAKTPDELGEKHDARAVHNVS
ncbi:hypothetical protein [Marinobacter metalliresistant]|jgi:hypothetical protein|uniref:Uncharacterized protein n=1 Tax=Marinobacter metalliresistant TaxID=2961995 RepID=A0ABZ2W2T8_9GAMM|tara:strand:+ start:10264 stop:10461 length:198 start_codon:yes stop_codon:yes gene_type:complete